MALTPADTFAPNNFIDCSGATQIVCEQGELRLFPLAGSTPPAEDRGQSYPKGVSQRFENGQRVWIKNHAPGIPCRYEVIELS